MPIVEVNGQEIEFPDSMSATQIKDVLRQKFPQQEQPIDPSQAGGAGEAFGMGLGRAVPYGGAITSGLGAGIAKLGGAEGSLPELYQQAQEFERATGEAHPLAAGLGTVTGVASTLPLASAKALYGAVPTGGARGALTQIPKALQKVGEFAGRGGLAARAAKGAAVTAPVGALYGAGEAAQGEGAEGAISGAGMAAGLGAALPVAGAGLAAFGLGAKNLFRGFKARDVEALDITAKQIRRGSSRAYEQMRASGATFTPEAIEGGIIRLQDDLAKSGTLNPRRHGKTISVLNDLRKEAVSGDLTLESLDLWRQELGDVAGDFVNKSDARKAKILISSIDEMVDNISSKHLISGSKEAADALRLGRAEWAKARKFESIVDIIKKADGDPNTLKRGLKRFVDNPKKMRGFSAREVSELKEAARLSGGEGIMKMLGRFGFDIGSARAGGVGALPVVSGLIGGATQGAGVGLAIPAVGTVARQAQKWVARGKAEKLLNIIEQGGEITAKQIGDLPVSDAKKMIDLLKTTGAGKVSGQ